MKHPDPLTGILEHELNIVQIAIDCIDVGIYDKAKKVLEIHREALQKTIALSKALDIPFDEAGGVQ